MNGETVNFKRRFQVWSYTNAHGQLLLRSPKSAEFGTRVDVLFKNVASINLPTLVDDLSIERADDFTTSELTTQLGAWKLSEERKVFLIRGRNCEGTVVAGNFVHHEDDLDYDQPSSLTS